MHQEYRRPDEFLSAWDAKDVAEEKEVVNDKRDEQRVSGADLIACDTDECCGDHDSDVRSGQSESTGAGFVLLSTPGRRRIGVTMGVRSAHTDKTFPTLCFVWPVVNICRILNQ